MTWTFTFLVACWLWYQRLAAPFSSSSDRAGTTRRTARPPSASASPGCDNGGFRGFEDRFGNHIDIPSYKIHHPSFWYTMVYLFAIFRPDPKMCVFLFIQMRENQKVWVWLRKRIIVVACWFPTYSDIYEYNGNNTLQTVFVHGHRSNFCAQKVSRCFHMALS